MKEYEVPQDVARAFEGRRKALYAVNERGEYKLVGSLGWEAEEIVLDQALEECRRLACEAHARALQGFGSPLEYHMFRQRMDDLVLAQSTGFFRWRVRRHLRPRIFATLPRRTLARYADALGMSVELLLQIPDTP